MLLQTLSCTTLWFDQIVSFAVQNIEIYLYQHGILPECGSVLWLADVGVGCMCTWLMLCVLFMLICAMYFTPWVFVQSVVAAYSEVYISAIDFIVHSSAQVIASWSYKLWIEHGNCSENCMCHLLQMVCYCVCPSQVCSTLIIRICGYLHEGCWLYFIIPQLHSVCHPQGSYDFAWWMMTLLSWLDFLLNSNLSSHVICVICAYPFTFLLLLIWHTRNMFVIHMISDAAGYSPLEMQPARYCAKDQDVTVHTIGHNQR